MSTEILPSKLSRDEWLRWRQSGLGGSDAPAVAGASPYKSRTQLWMEKTGRGDSQVEPSMPMKWGLRLEPVIAQAYAERMDAKFAGAQLCYQSDAFPWQLATLDRLTQDGTIVELKSVAPGKAARLGEDGDSDSLPTEWVLQGQHQLSVTGLAVVHFCVFLGVLEDVRIYEVPRNEDLIAALNDLEQEFWSHVESKEPPPSLDARDAEELAKLIGTNDERAILDAVVAGAVDDYLSLSDQIRELEEAKRRRKGEILMALDGAGEGMLPDSRVVKCSVADIAERTQVVRGHRQVRLSIKGAKS